MCEPILLFVAFARIHYVVARVTVRTSGMEASPAGHFDAFKVLLWLAVYPIMKVAGGIDGDFILPRGQVSLHKAR